MEEAERLPAGYDSIGSGDLEETMDGVPGNAREAQLRRDGVRVPGRGFDRLRPIDAGRRRRRDSFVGVVADLIFEKKR